MAHKTYENFVLENKIEDMLLTGIDMNAYITADYSLTQDAGMKKVIHVYSATGDVEDLAMGEGNTGDIDVTWEQKEYTVGVTQGRFPYYDEQEMTDPMVVEVGLDGSAKTMINTFTEKAIAEFEKANLEVPTASWSFNTVVDAIAKMNLESEEGLFLLISPADQAEVRKALKDDLKYSEGFVRTGYIGSVCGVPVIVSKAVPAHKGYLATKEAVSVFIKKDTETEYERNADIRKNSYWIRKVAVVALTDATKVVKITVSA